MQDSTICVHMCLLHAGGRRRAVARTHGLLPAGGVDAASHKMDWHCCREQDGLALLPRNHVGEWGTACVHFTRDSIALVRPTPYTVCVKMIYCKFSKNESILSLLAAGPRTTLDASVYS